MKPGQTINYTFSANEPGTYYYQSGTEPDVQVEMGLFGAIIVYPKTFPSPKQAYNDRTAICPNGAPTGPDVPCSTFDREFLFLISEIDQELHEAVQLGERVDTTKFRPDYWFINGRNFPDTLLDDAYPLLPTQPYGALSRMHPGDRVLMRMIGIGRDLHPFHTHGNHMRIIAEDGRLRESTPGAGADLAKLVFTFTIAPGQTADAIFTWTGEKLGWDIYGHNTADPLEPAEYAPDHGKPFPTVLLHPLNTAFGTFWSGNPFLGTCGPLPPGEGGRNPVCAFPFLWHSHKQMELINNDIFPGGMMTILFVEHPNEPLHEGGPNHVQD